MYKEEDISSYVLADSYSKGTTSSSGPPPSYDLHLGIDIRLCPKPVLASSIVLAFQVFKQTSALAEVRT